MPINNSTFLYTKYYNSHNVIIIIFFRNVFFFFFHFFKTSVQSFLTPNLHHFPAISCQYLCLHKTCGSQEHLMKMRCMFIVTHYIISTLQVENDIFLIRWYDTEEGDNESSSVTHTRPCILQQTADAPQVMQNRAAEPDITDGLATEMGSLWFIGQLRHARDPYEDDTMTYTTISNSWFSLFLL